MESKIISSYSSFNFRRFSQPWVCLMTEKGGYDFSKEIGIYTGGWGKEGDLVVFDPVIGQVYGYGQKDHRGNRTTIEYAKWDGEHFIPCNRLGKEKTNDAV